MVRVNAPDFEDKLECWVSPNNPNFKLYMKFIQLFEYLVRCHNALQQITTANK